MEVAPNANPPVCRIMDFGKFKFDEAQRAKESRRKTTSSSIKEMKYRPKIGVGDFDTKTRQVTKFLGEGHKVKITIMFRGREMSHPELGKKLLDQVAEQVGTIAKIEAAPKLDGRNMIMVLAPDRRAGATTQKSGVRPKGTAPAGRAPTEAPAATQPQPTQPLPTQPQPTDQSNGRVRATAEATAAPTAPAPPPTAPPAAPPATTPPPATPAATSAAAPSSTEES